MIFEDWELESIEKALDYTAKHNSGLSYDCSKIKIEQVRSQSINKRYSLACTDKSLSVDNRTKTEKIGGLL